MSFVGLVPSERSSGERRAQGSITKAGNPHVRRLLMEAAWSARRRPQVGYSPGDRYVRELRGRLTTSRKVETARNSAGCLLALLARDRLAHHPRRYCEGILATIRLGLSNGHLEGLNSRVRLSATAPSVSTAPRP